MTLSRPAQILLLLSLAVYGGEAPLTNDEVIKLVHAGIQDSVIQTVIRTRQPAFRLAPEDIDNLRREGASDVIIRALFLRQVSQSSSTADASASALPTSEGEHFDIGVYYRSDSSWAEVLPETVNWRNWYFVVENPHSPNKVQRPLELLIRTPEGVAPTEYLLFPLRQRSSRREFSSDGGHVANTIPFEPKKIGNRIYIIRLTSLMPGEYALMPPGSLSSTNAAGSIGKLYTVHLLD